MPVIQTYTYICSTSGIVGIYVVGQSCSVLPPLLLVLSVDLLWIEGKCPSEHFTNIQADFIVEVEPVLMHILSRLLIIVDGCKCIQGPGYLEHFLQLILQKLLATAIVIEAEA